MGLLILKPKVAIIHYWWISNRGGEAVVQSIAGMYPEADIFVHVCDDDVMRAALGVGHAGRIRKTFISRLPGAKRNYQRYLPLMPFALEQLDLTAYDLIISSESGPAKGVLTRPDAVHVCYCHSPMRYLWDMHHDYLRSMGWLSRISFSVISHWLRVWDLASSARVDHFIANSSFVASRIAKFYRRDSAVIHPPVDVEQFNPTGARDNFYLCLGQLVAYKRVDLMVRCFNRLNLPLIIVGAGEEYDSLSKLANANIRLLGHQDFAEKKRLLETCKALVFPGLEDFGIVPVEAMAAGAPVIAYGQGGALDTVKHGISGILVPEQTEDAFFNAISGFEEGRYNFNAETISGHARQFSGSLFQERFRSFVENALSLQRGKSER